MVGDKCQCFWFLVLVFYKLVWQFDCILWYFVDVGNFGGVDVGQYMVQIVVEFVEQGDYFVMGEQCWFVVDWVVEVIGQVGDWFLQGIIQFMYLVDVVVYLCFFVFMFVGIQVEIEVVVQFVVFVIQFEEVYFWMLYIDIGMFFSGNIVNVFNYFKQVVNGFVFWEIGVQLFIIDVVEVLFLFFVVVGNVLWLQFIDVKFGFGEGVQLGQFFFVLWMGVFCQVGEKVEYLLWIFCYFGGEGFICIVVKV